MSLKSSRSILLPTALVAMCLIALTAMALPASEPQTKAKQLRDEEHEAEKYFDRWLNEDVLYIVSNEEKSVFKQLTTPEEKEKFIEQFWQRRDPNPQTQSNEFKEEHYRRLAYANERFSSGYQGWRTDRGRTYILFGPPDEIERRPTGGRYQRRYYEGGGDTVTYPFERWRYRHIPGVGTDVEIEFVDRSFTGKYDLALDPDEKDALFEVPGAGLKSAELRGLYDKSDRFNRAMGDMNYAKDMGMRFQDMPFERLIRYGALQRPPEIKFKDLEQAVTAQVSYNSIPFRTEVETLRLGAGQVLALVSLEIENSSLQYEKLNDLYEARLNIYGEVDAVGGTRAAQFEDTLASFYPTEQFRDGRQSKSAYQKILVLKPGLYKLNLVVKDANNGNLGTRQDRIIAPNYDRQQLHLSSLILARKIENLERLPEEQEMFVLGNLKILPNVERKFKAEDPLGVYIQVYNAGLDSSKMAPSVEVEYSLLRDGEIVHKLEDVSGNSIIRFGDGRLVLTRVLSLHDLTDGEYKLQVTVKDMVTGLVASREETFVVS